jgi:pimeloyl-ACP methyl ester carboxylesterase
MRRCWFIFFVFFAISLWQPLIYGQGSRAIDPKPGIGHTVRVPFVYEHPEKGSFDLYYELGKAFDPAKRTVFVIADGQQFYVRKGLITPLQDKLFGDSFNVVGIIGRGVNETVMREVKQGGSVDWLNAYQILNSDEWIEDIDSVRKDMLGSTGTVALYGRSGGALLVHQYLCKHPEHVATVFTQASVNRFLDAEFGLSSDTFWDEIGQSDITLQSVLLKAVARRPADRSRIMLLLQRQNLFVPAAHIAAERAKLIHILDIWDETSIAKMSKDYEVDPIQDFLKAGNPTISVRVFELFAPVLAVARAGTEQRIDPDMEVGKLFAEPLLQLLAQNKIAAPSMDFRAAHFVTADVYIVAGRYDHTADYRSQIALASEYPNHRLLLLNDDHDFLELEKTKLIPNLVQSALSDGIHGPEKAGIERQLGSLIYHEYR